MPEIGPDEMPAVDLFLHLGTQWRHDPMSGRRTSIDYSAIAPTAALLGVPTSPDLLHAIRVMEIEALNTWAAQR